jgi:hypothetical protein
MKLYLPILFLLAVVFLSACQEEVVSRRSTFASQFGNLNQNGWSVNNNDTSQSGRPYSHQDDPNVRVIRSGFSDMQFNTTFRVDDPNYRPQPASQPSTQPSNQPMMTPWGMAPVGN